MAGPAATSLLRYAVVDLAVAEPLRGAVTALRPPQGETLFDPSMPRELLQVGPWLVNLGRTPQIETALAGLPRGMPWGYYLHSDIELVSLRRALRKFNLARVPGHDREVLFRYWDPRVMRDFLRASTPSQTERFMEWIARIEAADGSFDVTAPREG